MLPTYPGRRSPWRRLFHVPSICNCFRSHAVETVGFGPSITGVLPSATALPRGGPIHLPGKVSHREILEKRLPQFVVVLILRHPLRKKPIAKICIY
jgi:hypothetical protein